MKLHMLFYFLYFSNNVYANPAKDILFCYMFTSKSHLLSMMNLARHLANRGHNVTIFGIDGRVGPQKDMINLEINDEDRSGSSKLELEILQHIFWFKEGTALYNAFASFGASDSFERLYDEKRISAILNHNYSFIVIDLMFPAYQIPMLTKMRRNHNTPYALFSTTCFFDNYAAKHGLSRTPASYAGYFTKTYQMHIDQYSFFPRLNFFIDAVYDFGSVYASDYSVNQVANLLNIKGIDNDDFYKERILSFIDYPRYIFTPQPMSSDLSTTAEVCTLELETLSKEIKDFMEKPSKGIIYCSFGSNIYNSPQIMELLKALDYFKEYQIIFSMRFQELPRVKPHIKIVNWANQKAILAHPKTSLFLTHTGLKSFKEALCNSKPIICTAFFSDQNKNCLEAIKLNIAEGISKFEFEASNVIKVMEKMLKNLDYYKKNAEKVKNRFLDNVKSPLQISAHYIERAMKKKMDGKKFKIVGAFNFSYVTYYLDLTLLLLIVMFLVSY